MNKTTTCLLALAAAMLLTGCVVIPPIHEAAMRGDTPRVQQLLDKGTDVNAKDVANQTALIYAASLGHTETVVLLLNRGANINATGDVVGWTALLCAAQAGHTECVKVLLEHGANLDQRNRAISTLPSHNALEWAREKGYPEIVELIEAASRKGGLATRETAPPPSPLLPPKNNAGNEPF
jgi:uncharacterized protein